MSLIPSSTSSSKLSSHAPLAEYKGHDHLTPLFSTTIGPSQLVLGFLHTLKDVGSLAGINKTTNQFIINAKVDKQALLQKEIDAVTEETPQERVQNLFIALVRSPLEFTPLPKNGIHESIRQRDANMISLVPLPGWPSWIAKEMEGKKQKPTSGQIQHLCNYLIRYPFQKSAPRNVIHLLRLFAPFAKEEVAAISKKYLERAVRERIEVTLLDGDRCILIYLTDWVGLDSLPSEIEQVDAVFLQHIDFLQQQQDGFPVQVRLTIPQEGGKDYCTSLANKIKDRDEGNREINYQEIRIPSSINRYLTSPLQRSDVVCSWYTISLNPPKEERAWKRAKN